MKDVGKKGWKGERRGQREKESGTKRKNEERKKLTKLSSSFLAWTFPSLRYYV
jgi:hypothetical protein